MPVRHSDKMTAHASLLVPFERLGLPFLFLCKQSWRWFSTKTRNFFARDLATEEAMTRRGDCDFRQSQLSGYKIAHIWHVRYRRLNSLTFTKSARSRDFLAFPLGVGRKINQSKLGDIITWFFKMAECIENCFWTEEKEVNLTTLWSEKPCLFGVTSSDYDNLLKKDCVSINPCLWSYFSIVPLLRTLPRALWVQNYGSSQQFFCFAVAILFVYIGSRNF